MPNGVSGTGLTLRNPVNNWKKYTKSNKSLGSKQNITRRNTNSKQRVLLNDLKALAEKGKKGIKKTNILLTEANTEAHYSGNGIAQTRTGMENISKGNRIKRLMTMFKGALKGTDKLDLDQYEYVLKTIPKKLDEKLNFIKIMETIDIFKHITPYVYLSEGGAARRIEKFKQDAFIKDHKLDTIGKKIDKTQTQKRSGQHGQNTHTYINYSEDELDALIANYKKNIFEDVIGLFLIVIHYITTVIITKDIAIFDKNTMQQFVEESISNPRAFSLDEETGILNNINVKLGKNDDDDKDGDIVGPTLFVTSILCLPCAGIIIGAIGGIGILTLGISLIRDYNDIKKMDKQTANIRSLCNTLVVLITTTLHKTESEFLNEGEYTLLKEFEPMMKTTFTDTEFLNFIMQFLRKRMERNTENTQILQKHVWPIKGWHKYEDKDGKTYYNSDEYSKKSEPNSLNRYKLVSWAPPSIEFVNRKGFNESIIIYSSKEFKSEVGKLPQDNKVKEVPTATNLGPRARPILQEQAEIKEAEGVKRAE